MKDKLEVGKFVRTEDDILQIADYVYTNYPDNLGFKVEDLEIVRKLIEDENFSITLLPWFIDITFKNFDFKNIENYIE